MKGLIDMRVIRTNVLINLLHLFDVAFMFMFIRKLLQIIIVKSYTTNTYNSSSNVCFVLGTPIVSVSCSVSFITVNYAS